MVEKYPMKAVRLGLGCALEMTEVDVSSGFLRSDLGLSKLWRSLLPLENKVWDKGFAPKCGIWNTCNSLCQAISKCLDVARGIGESDQRRIRGSGFGLTQPRREVFSLMFCGSVNSQLWSLSDFSSVAHIVDMKALDGSEKLCQLVSMVSSSSVRPYYFTVLGSVTDECLNDGL